MWEKAYRDIFHATVQGVEVNWRQSFLTEALRFYVERVIHLKPDWPHFCELLGLCKGNVNEDVIS